MTDSSPATGTPKRKRGEGHVLSSPSLAFSFRPSGVVPAEDESGSPHSSIAHRFSGLMLECGGGAATCEDDVEMEAISPDRKRQRSLGFVKQYSIQLQQQMQLLQQEQEHTPEEQLAQLIRQQQQQQQQQQHQQPQQEPQQQDSGAQTYPGLYNHISSVVFPSMWRPDPSSPSLVPVTSRSTGSRLRDRDRGRGRGKGRKRAGTPPLRANRKNGQQQEGQSDADDESDSVDPVRAALTWREDEISTYDPNDEDDDGTGVNGIGFKPSPSTVQARDIKRRQQIAEYKRREENDARTRRNQRRRGEAKAERNSSLSRRVRFVDAESRNIPVTTGW